MVGFYILTICSILAHKNKLFLNKYFVLERKSINTHLYAIFSMLFWGLSYVWSKIVFEYYSPLTTVFLRLVLSSLFLLSYIMIMQKTEKIKKRVDYWLFPLSALFNPFLYFLGESYGLNLVSPSVSAIIIATIPLFTPVLAFVAYREKISSLNIFGILISFIGISIMILKPDLSFRADPLGILYLFGGVVAALIYTLILKKLTLRYSPLCIITYQNLIGIIYFLPFFLLFHYEEFIRVKPNFELISSLLMLAIFASSLAFIFYTVAIRNLGMSKANVYSNLIPVFTALFAYFTIGEDFDFIKITGILIVVIGLFLSQKSRIRIYDRKYKKDINLR